MISMVLWSRQNTCKTHKQYWFSSSHLSRFCDLQQNGLVQAMYTFDMNLLSISIKKCHLPTVLISFCFFVFFCFQTSQGMILLSKLWSKQLHYETQYSVYIKDYFQKLKPSSFFLNKFNISTYTLIVQQCSSARTTENNQPHQPLKQSHAEDHTEHIEAASADHCWRTDRLKSRKEHHTFFV